MSSDEQRNEGLALKMREELGIADQRNVDVELALSNLLKIRPGLSYVCRPDQELPNCEAKFDSYSNRIEFRATVYSGMRAGFPRAKMTVMEEIAHAWLGDTGVRNRSIVKEINEKLCPDKARMERRAKYVAGAALAPLNRIEQDWDAGAIAAEFNISEPAAKVRLSQAKRVHRRRIGELRPLPGPAKIIDFQKEARRRKNATNSSTLERVASSAATPAPKAKIANGPPSRQKISERPYGMVGVCPKCRLPSLLPDGARFYCEECHWHSDALADGDVVV